MKLKKIEIDNFKALKRFEMDLTDYSGKPRFLTSIVGNNGSGKTSLLQAIALVLSLATRKISSINAFHWNGLVPESALCSSTRIKLELEIDEDEQIATQELVDKLNAIVPNQSDQIQPIAQSKNLTLLYQPGNISCLEGLDALRQLQGRFYFKKLLKEKLADRLQYYSRIGDVFWFDQYRNLGNSVPDNLAYISWTNGIATIRDSLSRWWIYNHLEEEEKTGYRDHLLELETKFGTIFPDTKFIGVKPVKTVVNDSILEEYLFIVRRNGQRYDISEMSSGEQTIFTLLYQFVNLEIARSCVLIDEMELHLHPPQQQAIYAYLRKLSPESQFIFTTHSPYLENVLFEDEIVRMEGGL